MSEAGPDRDDLGPIAESFLARFRAGERPSLSEYAAKYPELADQIRDLFPAMVDMEGLGALAADPTGSFTASSRARGTELRQVGDYRILREIGRGGMGVVYEAVQESLGRHVALKVLPIQGLGNRSRLERFRLEARSAARLHHTNIVPVHGVGEHEGVHYYAMQFIRGQGLDSVLAELRRMRHGWTRSDKPTLAPDELLSVNVARGLLAGRFTEPAGAEEAPATSAGIGDGSELSSQSESRYFRSVSGIGLQVAEALAHAHEHGVLHRDIKPSNLLLDIEGTVWVTDFGLAKAEGSDGPTETGDIVGTLRYMAPERFRGWSDPRSDVYGLGATLYELATLRPPFEDSDRARLISRVLHDEPQRPRRIEPHVPRDLETIILKAIAKEPGVRYPTAGALAEDLRRFAADRPILARRSAPPERAWRWCRRNPLLAALAGSTLTLLLAVAVTASVVAAQRGEAARLGHELADRQKEALVRAKKLELDLRASAASLEEARRRASESARSENAARRRADVEARKSRDRLVQLNILQATRQLEADDLPGALPWLVEALRQDRTDPDLHRSQVAALLRACPGLVRFRSLDNVSLFALSPDGRRLLLVFADDSAEVREIDTGRKVGLSLPGGMLANLNGLALSPDGRRLAFATTEGPVGGVPRSRVQIWDATTGRPVGPTLDPGRRVARIQFSADGRRLLTIGVIEEPNRRRGASPVIVGQELRTWDLARGRPIGPPILSGDLDRHRPTARGGGAEGTAQAINSVAVSADGRRVALSYLTFVGVWDVETGRPVGPPIAPTEVSGSVAHQMEFSPDGTRLLVYCPSGNVTPVRVWDVAKGRPAGPALTSPTATPRKATFRPDGLVVLLVLANDPSARLLDWRTGQAVAPSLTHAGPVEDAAFGADGRRVVTVSSDQTVRVWDAADGRPVVPPLRYSGSIAEARLHADGRFLTAIAGGWLRTWDLAAAQASMALPTSEKAAIIQAGFRPDGLRVFTADAGGTGRVWDAETGQPVVTMPGVLTAYNSIPFSADGRRVLLKAPNAAEIQVRDVASGRAVATVRPDHDFWAAYLSPDGRRLLVQSADSKKTFRILSLRFYDADNGRPLGPAAMLGPNGFYPVAFSDDGRRAVTVVEVPSAESRATRVWDLETGRPVGPPLSTTSVASQGAISPDGHRVLTLNLSERTLRVWDAETGKEVGPRIALGEFQGQARAAFSPDGALVVTATAGQSARVWDVATGRPVTPPLRHGSPVASAAFRPDGRRVATVGEDGTLRLWDLATGQFLTPPLGRGGNLLGLIFRLDGRRLLTWGRDEPARLWDLDRLGPGDLSDEDLRASARLAALREIDDQAEITVVAPPELLEDWESLKGRRASWGEAPTGAVVAWLRDQAADCERRGLWAAALAQIDALLEVRPDSPGDRIRRANVLKRLGRWDESFAESGRVAERGQLDLSSWNDCRGDLARLRRWNLAAPLYDAMAPSLPMGDDGFERVAVHILAGDPEAARRAVVAMSARFGDDPAPFTAYVLARTAALDATEAVPVEKVLRWAGKALEGDKNAWNLHILSLAQYRAGDDGEAIRRAQESIEVLKDWPGHVLNWLVLALANHRLGRDAEARRWHARARDWHAKALRGEIDTAVHAQAKTHTADWLEAFALFREVEAAVGPWMPELPADVFADEAAPSR